jgi:hypothetical protein
VNIFRNFLLPGGDAWPISGAFLLVGVLPPALRSMELNLTSLLAEIYTLSGWIKGQVTSKRFARQAQPKSKLLYLSSLPEGVGNIRELEDDFGHFSGHKGLGFFKAFEEFPPQVYEKDDRKIAGQTYCGNFIRRRRSWNRGAFRRSSKIGSTPR